MGCHGRPCVKDHHGREPGLPPFRRLPPLRPRSRRTGLTYICTKPKRRLGIHEHVLTRARPLIESRWRQRDAEPDLRRRPDAPVVHRLQQQLECGRVRAEVLELRTRVVWNFTRLERDRDLPIAATGKNRRPSDDLANMWATSRSVPPGVRRGRPRKGSLLLIGGLIMFRRGLVIAALAFRGAAAPLPPPPE